MRNEWNYKERPHKKVMLSGVEECKNITGSDVEHFLMGLGKCEWEQFMGGIFVQSIKEAIETGKNQADVTKMFSCDLFGFGYMVQYHKPHKVVEAFLFDKLFDVVNETPEELTVSIKKDVIQKN